MTGKIRKVLVTGGAGYVGSVLVPQLVRSGYEVKVLDLFIYGENTLDEIKGNKHLTLVKGDIRDKALVADAVAGCDAVIHLACISNDPSVELDPALSTSINFEAFEPLVKMSKEAGVKRFIFASSGSVYGVSDDPNVTEESPLVPVSYYNKYKAMCEPVLKKYVSDDFATVIIRPATICGYSPRQRLDLTVNILTNHAYHLGKITVFGGKQMRPNIHMKDIVRLYQNLLEYPADLISGKIYNAGFENYTVSEIAEVVRDVLAGELNGKKNMEIVTSPSDDIRSYHISSAKIQKELGFKPEYTIKDGVRDLVAAFRDGKVPDSMNDIRYYNVKLMKHICLK